MFDRQIIAYGELATVALVGYDGGAVAAQRLADHVIVTRSEHIPAPKRPRPARALRELIG